MLAKCGIGSISLQSPATYQFETECKRSFEFVMCEGLSLFLFDIIVIATNGKPLLKMSSSHSPSSATILLVVWSANGDGSASP